MADDETDDIYDDPETIGKTDDEVNGQPDDLPPAHAGDPTQSIYTPERDTTPLDTRGPIDELEAADAEDTGQLAEESDDALLDDDPTEHDPDAYHPGDVNPADEQDGTES